MYIVQLVMLSTVFLSYQLSNLPIDKIRPWRYKICESIRVAEHEVAKRVRAYAFIV
jgi:hypothetical protein